MYDATNRMVEGTNWKGDKSAYTYNGLGLRVNNLVTTHAGQTYDRDYVTDYFSNYVGCLIQQSLDTIYSATKKDSESNSESAPSAGKPGSKEWQDAKKKIRDGTGKRINVKTGGEKEEEDLLKEARQNLEKKPTYSGEGKSGYEVHPPEPNVGNDLPHIKWWDWSNGKANGGSRHIFFGKG